MSEYRIAERCHVLPTPAGAFHAVSSDKDEPARRLLLALLAAEQSPLLSVPQACRWSGLKNQDEVLELLYRMQELGWLQGEADPRPAPAGALEDVLPALLAALSGDSAASGKALLADAHGFCLARHGYTHETAEEVSALGADLLALHGRHGGLLNHNLGLPGSAWALVDAAGNSALGFWPLHIGGQHFLLAITGVPHFNQPDFVDLVWVLNKRYHALEKPAVAALRRGAGN